MANEWLRCSASQAGWAEGCAGTPEHLLAPLRPLVVLLLVSLWLSLLLFLLLVPELLTGAAPPLSRTTVVITMAITIVVPVIGTGAAYGRSAH